jgi:tripartite-type tricarboxylate transporter receptor subunit TctC
VKILFERKLDAMRKPRRRQRTSLLLMVAFLGLAFAARAQQEFPTKPIRFVVPFSPGGSTDSLARLVAQKMSENWGQAVVIENRTGASGTIGSTLVAKATPDGHTLLVSSSAFAISAALQPRLPYDPLQDFAGITRIGFSTSAVVVTPSIGVKTLPQFIEYARARPGKVLFSSAGAGSSTHLNGEKFRLAAGIKPVHVAFKGSADAMLEVLAGRVHYVVTGLLVVMPYIKDGRLVALAVVTPTRSPLLPDVPTVAETIPGYKRDGSHVMLAPAGTPRPIREKISNEVRRILTLPDVQDRMKNFDYLLAPSTPAEMDQILRADIETFAEVIRLAGLRPK